MIEVGRSLSHPGPYHVRIIGFSPGISGYGCLFPSPTRRRVSRDGDDVSSRVASVGIIYREGGPALAVGELHPLIHQSAQLAGIDADRCW